MSTGEWVTLLVAFLPVQVVTMISVWKLDRRVKELECGMRALDYPTERRCVSREQSGWPNVDKKAAATRE